MSEGSINPTIKDAKELCTRYRKRGTIILSFDSKTYHASSFGHDRDWCNRMRLVVEQIAGLVECGAIEIPGPRGEVADLLFVPIAESGETQ